MKNLDKRKFFQFKILNLIFLSLCTGVLLLSPLVMAQDQEKSVYDESLKDMYVVLGTTTIGAVLGLSTLSFVEEPSAHIKNIVVGGALGIIVGVGVVAFNQASKSRDLYLESDAPAEGGANLPSTMSSPYALKELSNLSTSVIGSSSHRQFWDKVSKRDETPWVVMNWTF